MIKKKILTVIPARYSSSRFPGKPLALIRGKPMVVMVYERAKQLIDDVIVATDSLKIKDVCKKWGVPVIMTSENHKTGTDRVAEVAEKMTGYDYYFNIQGDEPMFPFEAIKKIIKCIDSDKKQELIAFNCMAPIENDFEINSIDIPKVVTTTSHKALYLTRSPIPFKRDHSSSMYYKQLGIYAFTPSALKIYHKMAQGPLEKAESIEILRFLEHDYPVKMIYCDVCITTSVDRPEDILSVEHFISMVQ